MILYLISELDVGGAEKSLYKLVTGLDQARYGKPVVASLWGRGPVGQWLENAGIEVIYLHVRKVGLILATWRLHKILRSRRFDLLHTFLFHANFAGRLAALRTGVPVVSSIRVTEVDRPSRITLDKWTSNLVAAETCVSEAVREWSIERGLPAEKLVTVPNGIDVGEWIAPPAGIRQELGLTPSAKVALFVGRLHRQKGPDVLLNTAVSLRALYPDLHFVLVGSGPLRSLLSHGARKQGVHDNFHLVGRRDDIAEVLADSDLLVLPSRWEGMPNVVLEAMAAGRAVVATNVGGSPELVVNGQTGYLVPPEDPEALADAIGELVEHPETGHEMGAAGRERARRQFTIEQMVQRNQQLYDRILKSAT